MIPSVSRLFGSYQQRNSTSIQSNPNYWNIVPLASFLSTGRPVHQPDDDHHQPPTTPYVQIPNDSRYQFSEDRRERMNAQAVVQFKPTGRLEITVDGLYARNKLSDERSEQTNWFQPAVRLKSLSTTTSRCRALSFWPRPSRRTRATSSSDIATDTELYSIGGNLKWNFTDNLSLTLDANHSKSTTNPDNSNGPRRRRSRSVRRSAPRTASISPPASRSSRKRSTIAPRRTVAVAATATTSSTWAIWEPRSRVPSPRNRKPGSTSTVRNSPGIWARGAASPSAATMSMRRCGRRLPTPSRCWATGASPTPGSCSRWRATSSRPTA